jgi:hypothetical protein
MDNKSQIVFGIVILLMNGGLIFIHFTYVALIVEVLVFWYLMALLTKS